CDCLQYGPSIGCRVALPLCPTLRSSDLFEQNRANAEQRRSYGEIAARGQRGLAGLTRPLVALVRGYAIGGGLAIALQADVRFASSEEHTSELQSRVKLGCRVLLWNKNTV